MSNDDNYTDIVLEQILDQNKAVLEAVGQLQDKVNTLAKQEDLDRIEAKVDTIQAAVKDANKDMASLENRVSNLETAA